ncbi:MAG: hypothetical protein KUF74_16745 [Candidatus Thiodiazotropha sp. (ex Ctena orbiculata)]|nr:hypothetical protein [Candidatus Thiodiazotropha taylori]MCG7968863.1 hypothetical protein [Candidatus Thiodiazotropha taylori]MCG8096508.1 hypothetical protein [Candidatus Thiodiazotropha endolucinida]
MNVLMVFLMEIFLSLGISFVMLSLLKPHLREVLTDNCGTRERAEFWVIFTQLMLVISPLLVVVYFAPTETFSELGLVNELRETLFRVLLGDFIALSAIGYVIWKSIQPAHHHEAASNEIEVG